MLSVTEWERIRRMYYVEQQSLRQIAEETGRARRTVKRMVMSDEPPRYQRQQAPRAPKLGPYKERIEALLLANKQLPRKQRWTSPRIYAQIRAEGYAGAESTVRHFVGQVRKRLKQPDVYLPLEFDPGSDAQVDWGEAEIIYRRRQMTVQLFLMKLSYSRRTFMMAFPSQKQEAFFAGHVAAFDFFGGVPHRISYDNLKAAVKEVLVGRHRVEQESFIHFRGHYLFDSHFCTPGAGNEKGQVEHSVGYNRRRYLVPLPEVDSFDEFNRYLVERCLADDTRTVTGQPAPIGQMWEQERARLRPLPAHAFDCCRVRTAVVNRYSQVRLETNRYSVPCDSAERQLTAKVYPLRIELYRTGDREPIAVHERCYDRHQERIDPLHYLPLLRRRPGAFNHARPLRQWRKRWPPVYEALLAHLQSKWPEGRGVREFIDILYLHRDHDEAAMTAAIEHALHYHCAHLDGVKLALRQLGQPDVCFPPLDLQQRPHLAAVVPQTVNAAVYDGLRGEE